MLRLRDTDVLIQAAGNESLPVAHRRDGCDPINAVSGPEKRLRMWIASICTLGVNSIDGTFQLMTEIRVATP